MTESYHKMLFDNPGYKFTNVTKFLGEDSLKGQVNCPLLQRLGP